MIVVPGAAAIDSLLVLGFGVTGRAVAQHALRAGVRPFVSEAGALDAGAISWLGSHGVPLEQGKHSERFLGQVDAVVLSPGVPIEHRIVRTARARGLPVLSELDLASLQAPSIPIVAVTGTNGKGTTVTVIDAMLRRAGRSPLLGGNIGTPFVSLLDRVSGSDVVVLEASSYQLEQTQHLKPAVAVLLNLTPDHLKRHGTMEAYAAAKGRIFQRQDPGDVAVLPAELAERFTQGSARRVLFDAPPPELPAGAAGLSPHNRSNLAAALCAVRGFDPSIDPTAMDVADFDDAFRLPHRMETVGSIAGVRLINDSKSTNADSAIAALRAIDRPAVLLLGGRSKGAGYKALSEEIHARDVRTVVAFGEAANDFERILADSGIEAVLAPTLEEAVEAGLAAASAGDVLLFSPACSSFDSYRNYEERGDAFVRAVRRVAGFSFAEGKDVDN